MTATTVTATASDENASVAVTPGDADGGTEGHQVDLPVGEAVITVEVTAQDGETTAMYVVRVTRQEEVSSLLESLDISRVTLMPQFSPETPFYKTEVEHDVHVVTVDAVTEDVAATVVIMLDGVVDQDGALALGEGASVVQVVVTSGDGTAETTYTIVVTRAKEQLVPLPTPVRSSGGLGLNGRLLHPRRHQLQHQLQHRQPFQAALDFQRRFSS